MTGTALPEPDAGPVPDLSAVTIELEHEAGRPLDIMIYGDVTEAGQRMQLAQALRIAADLIDPTTMGTA